MSVTQGVALGSIIPGRWPGNDGVEEEDHRNVKLVMRPRLPRRIDTIKARAIVRQAALSATVF
jgi:hypothetical protein